jgi:tetratricopeptide (TPR) repeat protein
MAHGAVAQACRSLNKLQEAKEEQIRILAAVKVKRYSHLLAADVQLNLAETLLMLGELEEAEKLQRAALDEHTRVLGQEHTSTLLGMQNLAVILGGMGKFKEEKEILEPILTLRERLFGIEHPQTSVVALNLVFTLQHLGLSTEVADITEKYLTFLLKREPETLGAYQYCIRQWLDSSDYDPFSANIHVSRFFGSREKVDLDDYGQHTRQVDLAIDLFLEQRLWSVVGILSLWRLIFTEPATVIRQLSDRSQSDIRNVGVKGLVIGVCLILILTAIQNVFGISELAVNWLGIGSWVLLVGLASVFTVMTQSMWLTISAALLRKRVWVWAAASLVVYLAAETLLSRYAEKPVALATSGITAVAGGTFFGILFAFRKTSSIRATIIISVALCILIVFFGSEPTWTFKYVDIIGMLVGFLRLYYLPVHGLFLFNFFPKKWYRYHPVLWDHLIRFPLIGLDKFLIKYARHSSSQGYELIQRLLSGYPSQRGSALQARLALALENWV